MITLIHGCALAILGFWTPGPTEIILVLVVILLLFGGKKLPELARGLGRGLRSFRSELKGIKDDIEDENGLQDTPDTEAKPKEQTDDKQTPEDKQ